ncbi:unnamed protein product [Arabis nemorensis]|uniref:Uncharacterized protein n=1 Tax=Arabis nemorensis TaxID=586526 RepID=A0A565CTD6_9BRAS|nr:unnamed protein product [Arabis nemorensis]
MEGIESASRKGRRVVVIGGGIAGSLAVKMLQFDADVTLIDPLIFELKHQEGVLRLHGQA